MRNLLIRIVRPQAAEPPADPLAVAEIAEAEALAAQASAQRRAAEADADLRETQVRLRKEALEQKARLEAEERERLAAAKRARDDEAAREQHVAASRSKWQDRGLHARRVMADNSARARRLLINIGVNGAAGFGQYKYFTEQANLERFWGALLAVLLELLAVTVLDYALSARKKGRSGAVAFTLSALMAMVVAALNYSHWSATTTQQGLAIPFALMSLMSPVLWAWYAAARDAEQHTSGGRAAGDGRPPARDGTSAAGTATPIASFSLLRWIFWLPETFAAKRQAIRHQVTDPDDAVELAVEHLAAKRAARDGKRAARLAAKRQAELTSGNQRTPDRYLPTADEVAGMSDEDKRESAKDAYRAARLDGVELTGHAIAARYGMSESWGRARTREVKAILRAQVDDIDADDEHEQAQ